MRALKKVRRLRVTFDDAYRNAATVFPALEQLGLPVTIFVCTRFARDGAPLTIPELAGDDPKQLETLTWDELRAHAERGVRIESHGISHAHLPKLGDDELTRELRDSKQELEDQLGAPCTEIAYPYGEHDQRVRAAARSAGYERAFALWHRSRDPYSLPRLDLYRRHSPVSTLLRLFT